MRDEFDHGKAEALVQRLKDYLAIGGGTPLGDLEIVKSTIQGVVYGPPRDVLEELANGAVVKIRVTARDRTLVDEPDIRRAFNKYAHVSRFETIIERDDTKVEAEALFTELSHSKQLSTYVNGMDAPESVKKQAIKLGGELIAEVLGD